MNLDNLDSELINITDFNTSKNQGDLFHICSKVYDNMKLKLLSLFVVGIFIFTCNGNKKDSSNDPSSLLLRYLFRKSLTSSSSINSSISFSDNFSNNFLKNNRLIPSYLIAKMSCL